MRRLLLLATAGIGLLAIARHRAHPAEPCRLEQHWDAGDVHRYEWLEFLPDGVGDWHMGSFDQEIQPEDHRFTWSRDASTVTIDGRELQFQTEPRTANCMLHFDARPLPDSNETYWYSR